VHVQAGDLIATMDDTSARDQVARAELSLATSQAQLAKLRVCSTAAELSAARAKVQPPICDCYNYLAAHHLSLQMGVAVVLAGQVVAVAALL